MVLSWLHPDHFFGDIFFRDTSTCDDTIYRCGDTHSTCSDIIDECFTIFSFIDLISILPYETCIPLPISWFHLSTEAFSRGEDFFLRGERKGIIGRKGFIPSWKLHDE